MECNTVERDIKTVIDTRTIKGSWQPQQPYHLKVSPRGPGVGGGGGGERACISKLFEKPSGLRCKESSSCHFFHFFQHSFNPSNVRPEQRVGLHSRLN